MSDPCGANERVEVLARGQDIEFRLPCGDKVRATRDFLSKSRILRQALHTFENNGEAFLDLPKGYLATWVQCAKPLSAAASEHAHVAERCRAWPIPRIVEGLQVGISTSV